MYAGRVASFLSTRLPNGEGVEPARVLSQKPQVAAVPGSKLPPADTRLQVQLYTAQAELLKNKRCSNCEGKQLQITEVMFVQQTSRCSCTDAKPVLLLFARCAVSDCTNCTSA